MTELATAFNTLVFFNALDVIHDCYASGSGSRFAGRVLRGSGRMQWQPRRETPERSWCIVPRQDLSELVCRFSPIRWVPGELSSGWLRFRTTSLFGSNR